MKPDNPTPSHSLENAPDEVKLAVDLIYLFESNEVDPKTALAALDIVRSDLENKLQQENK